MLPKALKTSHRGAPNVAPPVSSNVMIVAVSDVSRVSG